MPTGYIIRVAFHNRQTETRSVCLSVRVESAAAKSDTRVCYSNSSVRFHVQSYFVEKAKTSHHLILASRGQISQYSAASTPTMESKLSSFK